MATNKVIFHFIFQMIILIVLGLGLTACRTKAQPTPTVAVAPQATLSLTTTASASTNGIVVTPPETILPTHTITAINITTPTEMPTAILPTPQPTPTSLTKVQNVSFRSFERILPPDIRQQSIFFAGGGGGPSIEIFSVFINCEAVLERSVTQTLGRNNEIGWMGDNWLMVCGWQPNEQVTITITLANGEQTQATMTANEQGMVLFNCFVEKDSPLGVYNFMFQGKSSRVTRDLNVVLPPGKQLGAGVFWFAIGNNSYCQDPWEVLFGPAHKAVILSPSSGSTWEDCLNTETKPFQQKIERLLLFGFAAHERVRLVAYANFISWQALQVDENGRLFLQLQNLDLTQIGKIAVIGETSGEIGCYPSWGGCWHEENYSTWSENSMTEEINITNNAFLDSPISYSYRASRSAVMGEDVLEVAADSPIEITISATTSKAINNGRIFASFPTENCGADFVLEAENAQVFLPSTPNIRADGSHVMVTDPTAEIELTNWQAGESRSLQLTITPCPFGHLLEIHFRISSEAEYSNEQQEPVTPNLGEEWEGVEPVDQPGFGVYEDVRSIWIMQP